MADLIGLALLALPLFLAFQTIENARWINNMPPLIIPILLSLLLGHYLSSRGTSRVKSIPVALVSGAAAAAILGLLSLSGGAQIGMGLFILAVAWWTASVTVWLAYRRGPPVLLAFPGVLVVLITLAFLSSDYFERLPIYLLSVGPAIAYFHFNRVGGTERLASRLAPLVAGVGLIGLAAAFTWPSPTPQDPIRPSATEKLEAPLYEVWEKTADVFDKLPNRKGWPQFNLHPNIPFTSPTELTEDVLMRVESNLPHRWRLRVYETYTAEGWERTPDGEPTKLRPVEPVPQHEESQLLRLKTEIEVRLLSTNTHIASAGLPIATSVESLQDTGPSLNYDLLAPPSSDRFLPSDVGDVGGMLDANPLYLQDEGLTTDFLDEYGLRVIKANLDPEEDEAMQLMVERELEAEEVTTALLFRGRQGPPKSYVSQGSISIAPAWMLRDASEGFREASAAPVATTLNCEGNDDCNGDLAEFVGIYPTWVTDRYLQLPGDFPETVKALAENLTVNKSNAYDVATGIEGYLRNIPYSLKVAPPPAGRDGVEWFLMEQGMGFCNYFASAMVTMLRSVGIPARMVIGFAPGDWDPGRESWIVRGKHYHSWPEVYFPEFGWVEFEPTPVEVQPSLSILGIAPAVQDIFGPEMASVCFDVSGECTDIGELERLEDISFLEDLIGDPTTPGPGEGVSSNFFKGWQGALVSALGVVAVAGVGTRFYLGRLTNRLGAPAMSFRMMGFMAGLGGVPRQPHYTPAEYGLKIAVEVPGHGASVDRVVNAYEVSLYDRTKQLELSELDGLMGAWKSLRWRLLGLIGKRLIPKRPRFLRRRGQ